MTLAGDGAAERAAWRWHHRTPDGVALDVGGYLADRGPALAHIAKLLRSTAGRPPVLGCFGLHEWAMVHGGERRHPSWPLRLTQEQTDRVVEDGTLRCTHFDAFRFFTPTARPRNVRELSRATQVADEQPGCLHATMDLYKWAYKLGPAIPSALTADCFALAREVRSLDMRASPYDFRALGLEAVRVETGAGRAQYVREQRGFTERGQALRVRLIAACARVQEEADAAGTVAHSAASRTMTADAAAMS